MKRSSSKLRTVAGAVLAAALAAGCAAPHSAAVSASTATFEVAAEVSSATSVLRSYESALNAGDVDSIVSLYAPDAVFMAQHRTPAVGRAPIEAAYREIFGMILLDVRFEIDEVAVVSPTVAFARTRSAGTTTPVAGGDPSTEGNQELFVLVREDPRAAWQIGRYIFSTTQPRR